LEEYIKNGKFRLDLFYRINIFSILIPPLRERKDDIQLLVDYFIHKMNKQSESNVENISQKAIECIEKYDWPGNIRDLENAIQSASILCQESIIQECHLPLRVRGYNKTIENVDSNEKLDKKVERLNSQIEKELILDALGRCNYNRTKAAEKLKISRKTLFNKMKKYQL
jgi:transcriptional regulator with PAS, ATPase and Fis domain